MHRVRRHLWLGALLSVPVCLLALDPAKELDQYGVRLFTTADGLPQSSVMAVAQTSDGYLWLGTYEGLARFDGVRFSVFDKTNTPGIINNSIKTLLAEDRGGGLWIGTIQGLLHQRLGRFRRYGTAAGLPNEYIQTLAQDAAGSIWVGTPSGLARWQGERFRVFTVRDGLASDKVNALCHDDRSGWLWIGTDKGLCVFHEGRFRCYGAADGLPHPDVRALCADGRGNVWIGTGGGGLARWLNNRCEAVALAPGLSASDIRALACDRFGVLWIGTNDDPLLRFQAGRSAILSHIRTQAFRARAILEDHEGSLWVGTRDGLLQLSDDKFVRYDSLNGLPVDPCRCVYADREGAIWIGTIGGGLVKFFHNAFTTFGRAQGLRSEHIWSIAQSGDGSIWFGTYGGGLHRLKNGRIQVISRAQGLSHDIVRAVFVDHRDRLWVGTDGGGVDVLAAGRIIAHYGTVDGLASDYIYAISEDREGAVWIGSYDGSLCKIADGKVKVIGRDQGLSGKAIWAITPDRDGSLWLGTDHGGLKCLRDGRLISFSVSDGLASDQAFQILEDRRGNLWLNSNVGIYAVSKADLYEKAAGRLKTVPCLSYGKREGIRTTESSGPAQPAGCLGRDGRLWFATVKGVAVFTPERPIRNKVPPPVCIERVRIDGREYPADKRAEVPPGQGRIEFEFAAPTFLLPEKASFKYKLEGFDSDWTAAGIRRMAFYTNLPPGRYTFRATAANSDNVWNPVGASFSFRLRPHFRQTWLFQALLGILALSTVSAFFFFRLQNARRRARRLGQLVKERTDELHRLNFTLQKTNFDLQAANRKLEHLAANDGLTGIPNYRTFVDTFQREWRAAQRQVRNLALVAIDIDHFKAYNDSLGHQKGDECLHQVAVAIRRQLRRAGDLAARLGGEEFALLLPETDADGARRLAENVRRAVADLAIAHPASPVAAVVTISLGVTTGIPTAEAMPGMFLRRADEALYEAKHAGRNRSHFLEFLPPTQS